MKKGIFWMLLTALILSYFDGIMTYISISSGYAYEINPIPAIIHDLIGLNNWLLMHTILGIIIALIVLLGKYEKVVKCWLVIEILIMCLHLTSLKMYLF
jgi:uncharacterized protein DUF5658